MGYDIYAYVEKKTDDGKWTLVTQNPVSGRLKYIFDDYREFQSIEWDNLSEGLKEKYKKDADGNIYATFYTITLQDLEDKTSYEISKCFSSLNMIVKALGCERIYSDDGEEREPWGDDGKKDKLTFPINKELVEDLQYGYDTLRKAGQREAFDLFLSEYIEYDGEYRVIFAVL